MLKNLPATWKIQVRSLGHSLEKGMATHFSVLAWRIPWTEEPGRLQRAGLQVAKSWPRVSNEHSLHLLSIMNK